MSTFRMIRTAFWTDPKVEEKLTPEDKYFFLYVLTNPRTTQTGIYQTTRRQMAFDLGYSIETVDSLLERFIHHLQLIRYNPETRELAIKNWGRYNLRRGGKPMIDCITSELKEVKDKRLISYVRERVTHQEIKALYETFEHACPAESEEKDANVQEKEDKNSEVRELFDYFVSKNIIRHKRMTAAMRRAIQARIRDYTYDELKNAIDNYAHVYFSKDHWFTHKYPLADFMRDKDIRKFLDEADPIHNFSIKQPITKKRKEIREEDFDLS